MQIDVFQTPGNFPNNNPALGCFYGLVASVDFMPVIGSFICNIAQDKAYEVIQILYSADRNRAIVVTVPQTFSIAKIFDIPGDINNPGPVDIFNRAGKVPDNAPDSTCGYGLVASVDFVPALHSFYCNVGQDKVYEVTDILYSTAGNRTIVLTVPVIQSVTHIFDIPGGA